MIAAQVSYPSIAAEAHAAPKAKSNAIYLIAGIDDLIATIERLLRNPNRRLINGPIEGRLPYFMQNEARSDAQADFDQIKSQAAISLITNSLIQTGELSEMDAELIAMREKFYRKRQRAIRAYNHAYADLIEGNPSLRLNVSPIADRYLSAKDLPRTSTKVDYNNPLLRGVKR